MAIHIDRQIGLDHVKCPFSKTFNFLAILVASAILVGGCAKKPGAERSGLTFITDPGAKSFGLAEQLSKEFTAQTGISVALLKAPEDTTERLSQYLQFLGARSSDVDVYQIDVIWPAMIANHLVDLKDSFSTETQDFFPAIIQNNTIRDRLVAIPYYGDAGLLYYRKDLLTKYGISQPPQTWDELTTMAALVQGKERHAGNPDFWGFVWQGRAYEGLTCDALEWQVSEGGGTIIDEAGRVTINNQGAAKAFTRAARWVGTISPPGVTTYAEEEGRQMFQAGNALFMRNWPYAYALANDKASAVRGKIGVVPLPSGSSRRAATLGGWQLAVSKYSHHQKEAIEFIRFLTSARAQKIRAMGASLLPVRTALFSDPEIIRTIPFLPEMKIIFENSVARPSAAAGADYNEVSTYYYEAVHKILTGQEKAAPALDDLAALLYKVLQK